MDPVIERFKELSAYLWNPVQERPLQCPPELTAEEIAASYAGKPLVLSGELRKLLAHEPKVESE